MCHPFWNGTVHAHCLWEEGRCDHSIYLHSYHRHFVYSSKKRSKWKFLWGKGKMILYFTHQDLPKTICRKGILNSFRENLKRKYNAKDWALQRLRRLVLCQQPSSKLCKFTNELHSQLMEAMSMHQAAAKQFKSTTGNMLIAVHFVICFICSTVFLLNCFLIAYLLNRASQLYFPGHQLKGLTRVGSLILPSETGLGMIAELHLSCPASNYIWRSFWLPQVFQSLPILAEQQFPC